MRNNNKPVLRLLSAKLYQAQKSRGRVLTGAVAFVVILIFSVFSLSVGKIESDCLRYGRMAGTTAYTTLERASEAQIAAIEKLDYIKETGTCVIWGETEFFTCQVLDETAYEKMQKPAYSDIHGTYPKEENEIMLPMRALSDMGITEPSLGMEINIEMKAADGENLKQTWILSGYYTEYVDPQEELPRGYFSEKLLEKHSLRSGANTVLLIQQKENLDGESVETCLYHDVKMTDDTQQFFGGNAMTYSVVYEFAGGFDMAILLALVIFAGAFMLLYNVMSISMVQDVRQYGLLKTLGTTKWQLFRIVYSQIAKITLRGCLIGSAAGLFINILIVPNLLENMYLHGFGSASAMIAFRPWILAVSIVFGIAVAFLSASFAVRKVLSMGPVEAIKYMGFSRDYVPKRKSVKPRRSNSGMGTMAFRNLFRSPGRFLITVCSLTLSITVALSAVVLTRGLDQTEQIDYEFADFSVLSAGSAMTADDYKDDEMHFEEDFAEELLSLDGVTDWISVTGGFGRVNAEQEALSMRLASWDVKTGEKLPFVVQSINEDMVRQLADFAEEKELTDMVDIESFRSGEGVIVLHYHNLSRAMEEKSKSAVGMPIDIYSLGGERLGQMQCSGYLDFTKKGFPNFKTTWNGPAILYFLVSEKGFEKMKLPKRIFGVDFQVTEEDEPFVKAQVQRLIGAYNREKKAAHPKDLQFAQGILEMSAKSDILMAEKDYIRTSRIVMGSLCLVLLCMGLLNYINVTLTSLTARKKEFAVMESIGMTRKQLRKSIVLEGIFYSGIVSVLTLIVGSGVLQVLRAVMNQRIAYFTFYYPWDVLGISILALFVICTVIPLALQRKNAGESVIERLRMYT